MNIIFATGNKGKAKEVKNLFEGTKFNIIAMFEIGDFSDIEENGNTYEENAFLKAKYIYDKYKVPVISDDSGLEVEQLGGRPGVFSARYAGEGCSYDDNNNKLLAELQFFDEPHPAKFVCCALFYDGSSKIAETGELAGRITHEKKGNFGFGYDPVFIPDGIDETMSELPIERKNKLSHRSKAFQKLKNSLLKEAFNEN